MAAAPALAPDASPEPAPIPEQPPESQLPQPQSFKEVVDLFRDRREMILYSQLQNNVHLVAFENQLMELRLEQEAPRDLVNNVSSFLNEWTGQRWVITVSSEEGEATLGDQARAEDQRLRDEAETDEVVQAVKSAFPGAKVSKVIPREPAEMPDAGPEEFDDELEDDED